MKTDFTLADFDFDLPEALIAQHPTAVRSAARLLDGRAADPIDRGFADLPQLLNAGDLLLFNDTKVVKARLFGEKASGGKLEMLIERVLPASTESATNREVVAHIKVSKKTQHRQRAEHGCRRRRQACLSSHFTGPLAR